MLAIRLKRTGRSGHAQFRVIVQDARSHPKSGKVVEYLGSYNPHTKAAQLKSQEISEYLEKGAQPSDRVAKLLKSEGIKLPSWVKISPDKKRDIRNPEKLRRNAPPDEAKPVAAEPEAAEPAATDNEAPAEQTEATKQSAEPEAPAGQTPESEAEQPSDVADQSAEPAATAQAEPADQAGAPAKTPEETA